MMTWLPIAGQPLVPGLPPLCLIRTLRASSGVRLLQSTSPQATCLPATLTIAPRGGHGLVFGLPPLFLIRICKASAGVSPLQSTSPQVRSAPWVAVGVGDVVGVSVVVGVGLESGGLPNHSSPIPKMLSGPGEPRSMVADFK